MRETFLEDGWGPEAADRLAGALAAVDAEGRPGVATLDFDDTCIAGDLGDAVFHRAVEDDSLDPEGLPGGGPDDPGQRPAAWLAAADEALERAGPGAAYSFVLEAFGGWTLERFREHVRGVLEVELTAPQGLRALAGAPHARVRSGIRRRRRMGHLIGHLRQRGWTVLVVSGSAEWAVEEAVAPLGVAPGEVRGQRTAVRGGLLTRSPELPHVFGPGKVQVLSTRLSAPPDLAIGDSPNDRELLGWATHAVAFDAGDANSIGPEARARGWAVEPARAVGRPSLFDRDPAAHSVDDDPSME